MSEETLGDMSFLESLKPDVIDILKELGNKLNKLLKTRHEIGFIEEKLKEMKKEERELSGEEIPNLLLGRGLSSIKLETGERVEILEKLAVSVPKDRTKRSIIFTWLVENGGNYLIKKELKVEEPEDSIIEYLKFHGIPFTNELGMNTNSLKAFLNDKLGMKKGSLQVIEISDIPKEINPFIFRETKIT